MVRDGEKHSVKGQNVVRDFTDGQWQMKRFITTVSRINYINQAGCNKAVWQEKKMWKENTAYSERGKPIIMSSLLDRTVNWCSLCCWTLFPQWSCRVKRRWEDLLLYYLRPDIFVLPKSLLGWRRVVFSSSIPFFLSLCLSIFFFFLFSSFSDEWSAAHIQCEQETDWPIKLIKWIVYKWPLEAFYYWVVIFGETDLKEYFNIYAVIQMIYTIKWYWLCL